MVSVCVALAQNSFYHFGMVVACITFGLLAVAEFQESSDMPTADWISGRLSLLPGLQKLTIWAQKVAN